MEAHRGTETVRAGTRPIEVRPIRSGEDAAVRALFRATLLRGRPMPAKVGDLDLYTSLCLDWYLTHGRIIVAVEDGKVQGYLLACLDEPDHRRWARWRALRWAAAMAWGVALGRRRGDARRFVWLRVRDALHGWRHAPPPPFDAHAHVNLAPWLRSARTGPRLARAMDELVADVGLTGWYGEMNVVEGRSLAVLERIGVTVAHRQPSRTFSWLEGTSIERITLARPVPRPSTTVGA